MRFREIDRIRTEMDACEALRLNLFIPSINVSDLFVGIFTAVRLFEQLGEILGSRSDVRMRIITDRRTTDHSVVDLTKWKLTDQKDEARYQILELINAQAQTISLSKRDIFIATWWSTAFRAARLREWQKDTLAGRLRR